MCVRFSSHCYYRCVWLFGFIFVLAALRFYLLVCCVRNIFVCYLLHAVSHSINIILIFYGFVFPYVCVCVCLCLFVYDVAVVLQSPPLIAFEHLHNGLTRNNKSRALQSMCTHTHTHTPLPEEGTWSNTGRDEWSAKTAQKNQQMHIALKTNRTQHEIKITNLYWQTLALVHTLYTDTLMAADRERDCM